MKKQYGAILLAGGQSSRMGEDKARLEIEGQTMLERILLTLHPLVAETVVMRATGTDSSPHFSGTEGMDQ